MYLNWYYLDFLEPVSIEDVHAAFMEDTEGLKVKEIFPGSFEVLTPLSYSKVKFAFDQWFPASNFYICKVKTGDIHIPG